MIILTDRDTAPEPKLKTPSWFVTEGARILKEQLDKSSAFMRRWRDPVVLVTGKGVETVEPVDPQSGMFAVEGTKIGTTLNIRAPKRFNTK